MAMKFMLLVYMKTSKDSDGKLTLRKGWVHQTLRISNYTSIHLMHCYI